MKTDTTRSGVDDTVAIPKKAVWTVIALLAMIAVGVVVIALPNLVKGGQAAVESDERAVSDPQDTVEEASVSSIDDQALAHLRASELIGDGDTYDVYSPVNAVDGTNAFIQESLDSGIFVVDQPQTRQDTDEWLNALAEADDDGRLVVVRHNSQDGLTIDLYRCTLTGNEWTH